MSRATAPAAHFRRAEPFARVLAVMTLVLMVSLAGCATKSNERTIMRGSWTVAADSSNVTSFTLNASATVRYKIEVADGTMTACLFASDATDAWRGGDPVGVACSIDISGQATASAVLGPGTHGFGARCENSARSCALGFSLYES